jgi:hypothetical protein
MYKSVSFVTVPFFGKKLAAFIFLFFGSAVILKVEDEGS